VVINCFRPCNLFWLQLNFWTAVDSWRKDFGMYSLTLSDFQELQFPLISVTTVCRLTNNSSFSSLTSPSLCNFLYVLKFTLRRVFVSSYCLFNTTFFGLTGHHRVYKIVVGNWCSVVTLLCFAFYEKYKMLIKHFKLFLDHHGVVTFSVHTHGSDVPVICNNGLY
jgi:hypothetical protein